MNFSSLQKKKSLVINTKIIIKVNNKNYSLQKSSLPIDNILSITRLYFKKDNKKFGKYNAYTKIVLFDKKIIYSPETFETIIKNSCKKSKKIKNNSYNNNKSSLVFISTKFIVPKKNNKPYCRETNGKYCLTGSTRNTQIIRSITRQEKKFGKYTAYTKIIRNTKTFAYGKLRKTFYSQDSLENLIKNSSISNSEQSDYYNMW